MKCDNAGEFGEDKSNRAQQPRDVAASEGILRDTLKELDPECVKRLQNPIAERRNVSKILKL
jgi:hypothetical protein